MVILKLLLDFVSVIVFPVLLYKEEKEASLQKGFPESNHGWYVISHTNYLLHFGVKLFLSQVVKFVTMLICVGFS